MAIDFSKLGGSDIFDTERSPRVLFDLLPGKDTVKFKYLRDVQSEVMDQWFARRDERDLLVKLNTGGGKTLVSLLLLKSSLNEGKGPAVYISPTPYLAQQVLEEARSLGLQVVDEPRSGRYSRGKAILVTTIKTLINGKSVFGTADQGVKLGIGTIVIDDAHACLEAAEEQFSINATAGHRVYDALFALFADDLQRQSDSHFMDVRDHHRETVMEVPYWAWLNKQKQVAAAIHAAAGEAEIEFAWPLLREHLALCHCVFGAGEVEITPRCLPITVIPSLCDAKRRIFTSATFSDDSVLVADFDVPPEALAKAIVPSRATDLGDRMILTPQEFNPELTDDDIKKLLVILSKKWNTVVIVPSGYRAKYWEDVAATTLTAANLAAGVQQLKAGHVGLVVLVNKYDGIDLPGEACRILVIDGVPDVRTKMDRVEEAILWGSDWVISRAIQRIEQGMGRGVRAVEDYCAVFLMGRSLTQKLYVANAIAKFTPATRAQLSLSEKLAAQLDSASLNDVGKAVIKCLNRDKDWVAASRAALTHVKHEVGQEADRIAVAQRVAFNAASIGDYRTAVERMESAANPEPNPRVKGWLKQDVAFYEHMRNPAQSQQILKSAIKLNSRLFHPIDGIEYDKLSPLAVDQATACSQYLKDRYAPNALVVEVNAILDDLVFKPETYRPFERALATIAMLIGFASQRPDGDTGVGPDILWSVGGLRFFVIECKNGATATAINKHDCDQLGGSVRWFQSRYDHTCATVPVMVHPVNVFDKHGTPPPDTRVITTAKLDELRTALRQFASSMARLDRFGPKDEAMKVLNYHKLTPDAFLATYTVGYTIGS